MLLFYIIIYIVDIYWDLNLLQSEIPFGDDESKLGNSEMNETYSNKNGADDSGYDNNESLDCKNNIVKDKNEFENESSDKNNNIDNDIEKRKFDKNLQTINEDETFMSFNEDVLYIMITHILSVGMAISSGYQAKHFAAGKKTKTYIIVNRYIYSIYIY